MATAIKINRLTPEQAAYLAGLIDGEGTITLLSCSDACVTMSYAF